MLRVGIRAQLSFKLLVTLTALVAVGVLAIVTLTQSLVILHNSVSSISTRLILQNALRRWHTGNNTAENWQRAIEDLEIVTGSNGGGFGELLQAVVYDPRLGNGNDTPGGLDILGGRLGLMNVTGENARGIIVPALKENGVVDRGGMVMGPLQVNSSFFMMSFTNPIINNTSKGDLLGFLTVVVNAQLVFDVVKDTRGLGDTGQVILVGPGSPNNLLSPREEALVKFQGRHPRNATIDPEKMTFRYLFPPKLSKHLGGSTNTWSSFPAVKKAFIEGFQLPFPKIPKPFDQIGFSMLEVNEEKIHSAGRMEKTVNAEGQRVSAGHKWEVFKPIVSKEYYVGHCFCNFTAPIVALTAFAEDSNVKECREAGMNSFLAKPIKRTELRKVLVEYCRHPPMEEVDKEKAGLGAIDGKKEMREKNASPVAAGPPSTANRKNRFISEQQEKRRASTFTAVKEMNDVHMANGVNGAKGMNVELRYD
ncbi:hypothetical protein EV426DRAFT_572120 [Tirmania nivea]|nr:hypothetical protein EV426DRAFT_572120 [Tirmania nivea]